MRTLVAAERTGRAADLASRLAGIEQRLRAACVAAGRRREELTLIAVTKTFPASDVAILAELGLRDFGENVDREARGKAAAVPGVRWHFVGRLQRNKCRSVAAYASVVHSVDRLPLVSALSRAAGSVGRVVDALVQVSLDGDPARGGALIDQVPVLADAVSAAPELRLSGVMAIAPLQADPDEAFAILHGVSRRLLAGHPDATAISAGMSGDLEAAVRHGATHVRVGTALLGGRSPNFG